jgi:hypothetical protein
MVLTSSRDLAVISNIGGKILCWRHFSDSGELINILYPECPYKYYIGENKTAWTTHGGGHLMATVLTHNANNEIYAPEVPNLLEIMKGGNGKEKDDIEEHVLYFDAKEIKQRSNFEFGIVSEFDLKLYNSRKTKFTIKTHMRSYEHVAFTVMLIFRIYIPFQLSSSILRINRKDEEKMSEGEDVRLCYAEQWDSIEIESTHGLTSIKNCTEGVYNVDLLQVAMSRHLDFVVIDCIRHIYLMPGASTAGLYPKHSVTFTPY